MNVNISAQNYANEMFMNENEIVNIDASKIEFPKSNKKSILIYAEQKNDTIFSIFIKNNLNENLILVPQDNSLYLIQEALDEKKTWKPIEFFGYSTCGNSYDRKLDFKENQIVELSSKKYNGNFNTKIRFKLLLNNKIYYSNEINSNINNSKFKKSDWFFKFSDIYKGQSKKEIENWLFLNKSP